MNEVRAALAAPERKDPNQEQALEAHARAYIIDRMLRALRWIIIPSTPDEIANTIPEAQADPVTGRRRFMDYFGYEREVNHPLLVVEAKRKSEFPIPPGGSRDTVSEIVASWLRRPQDAPMEWGMWLPSLQDYVVSVFLRTEEFPVRVAITDGDWLVVFENPQDAFAVGGACESRYIHVFINAAEIDERYDAVFRLLDQRQVSRIAEEVLPGSIRGLVDPECVVSLLHGLRLRYAASVTTGNLVPTITVVPTILLRSATGSWLRVSRGAVANATHFVPYRYEDLPRHLVEVREDAERLLGRVQEQLGRRLDPSPIEEHYADDESFEGMRGVEEFMHGQDHFWIVTGQVTHYLLPEPTVPECPHHDFAKSFLPGCQFGNLPIVKSTIEDPRAYFVTTQLHHCCHEDVYGGKHIRIEEQNEDRCGSRSGRRDDVFCEIAPFDEFLCCRTCSFQRVCTATEASHLPCVVPGPTHETLVAIAD